MKDYLIVRYANAGTVVRAFRVNREGAKNTWTVSETWGKTDQGAEFIRRYGVREAYLVLTSHPTVRTGLSEADVGAREEAWRKRAERAGLDLDQTVLLTRP